MKAKVRVAQAATFEPPEEDIRAYAYHLYEESGFVEGRDLENWLEAKACLAAHPSKTAGHGRQHAKSPPPEAAVVS